MKGNVRVIEEQLDADQISPEEAAFMHGVERDEFETHEFESYEDYVESECPNFAD